MTIDQLKVTSQHLARKAVVYLRQSSPKQVHENLQSQRLQYALRDKARTLGFREVEIIDDDLGSSRRWAPECAKDSHSCWDRWRWEKWAWC